MPVRRGRRSRDFTVSRLSTQRLAVLDVVRLAARQPTMHGLIEADVTGLLGRMATVDGKPTMTGLVSAAVARAVAQCPGVNVRRAGLRVVAFRDIAMIVTVEKQLAGALVPVPVRILDAADKTAAEITSELRVASTTRIQRPRAVARSSAVRALPPAVRRRGAQLLGHFPAAAARFGPPIGVTSLGMFGAGWGIPISPLTLMVTVGGTTKRLVAGERGPDEREFLPLTLSFDHTVIDGAPAARFATTFRAILETEARGDTPLLLASET